MLNAIGIFGGTFDPVHNAHLRIALDIQEALRLEQVRFLPLNQAVHREQPIASARQRVAMLRLAVKGQAKLAVDETEIARGGASYMVDTLRSLREGLPDKSLCLLLGSDAFNGFAGWKDPEHILQLAHIVVMQRPGYVLPQNVQLQQWVDERSCESFKSEAQAGNIYFHEVTQLDISSSDIRQRLAHSKHTDFLLPTAVQDYIQQQGLYAIV